MKESRLEQQAGPRMIEVPSFTDARGTLGVLEWDGRLPFVPERFYFIWDAPKWARRAGHAHWEESEAIFALSGAFTVLTDDGRARKEWLLDQPNRVLLIPPVVWHELYDFGPGAVCAVLASHRHDSEDYCSDYSQFLRIARSEPAASPIP
jgi:UDP-2-acetamido-3-amino-2,3-dideoxy-glucuronate N-acetyltransferase